MQCSRPSALRNNVPPRLAAATPPPAALAAAPRAHSAAARRRLAVSGRAKEEAASGACTTCHALHQPDTSSRMLERDECVTTLASEKGLGALLHAASAEGLLPLRRHSLLATALCTVMFILSGPALAQPSFDDLSKLSFDQTLELKREERAAATEARAATTEARTAEREDRKLALDKRNAEWTLGLAPLIAIGAAWSAVEVNRQNLKATVKTVVEETQAHLKADVAELKTDVAVLKTDVAVLKTDVAVLKTDVAETDVAWLKTSVNLILNILQTGGSSAQGR